MIPRITYFLNIVKNIERNFLYMMNHPPKEFALAYTFEAKLPAQSQKFTIKDLFGDGIFLAVPTFRRTVEKRWKRKYDSPEYVRKMLVAKTNVGMCNDCGHHHECGRLCENCYRRVQKDAKIQDLSYSQPKAVVVLNDEEDLGPKQFWNGKRVIEIKKEKLQWFSKNLLQKTTQQSSDSTVVQPIDSA